MAEVVETGTERGLTEDQTGPDRAEPGRPGSKGDGDKVKEDEEK